MSCEYDWEQTDKAMARELEALGIVDIPEPPTPEEIAEYERENWEYEYAMAMERVGRCAAEYLSRICPVCKKDVGMDGEFFDDDPSVGIVGKFWVNECPEHGEFEVEELV